MSFISLVLGFSLFSGLAFAETTTTLVDAELKCKVDQFVSRTGAVTTAQLKPCDRFKDGKEVKVKSMDECKQRAMEHGAKCLKLLKTAPQISVRTKFYQQFAHSQDSTTFTCELDKGGGSACP